MNVDNNMYFELTVSEQNVIAV